MKVVILCGGSGTRLREQTEFIPKPMIPIGGIPMIVHIMKRYSFFGINEFVLALGYKQEYFKQYFKNYNLINADAKVTTGTFRGVPWVEEPLDNWEVIMSDTGIDTLKGGRLKKIQKYVHEDTFMCTYGDSIGDINIKGLLEFHRSHGKIATVTGVHPRPRFGEIHYVNNKVISFFEKPDSDSCMVNGGFFVFEQAIFDYLTDSSDLEAGPLELLAAKEELMVYHHTGYWGCMDTVREMDELNKLCENRTPPWKGVW